MLAMNEKTKQETAIILDSTENLIRHLKAYAKAYKDPAQDCEKIETITRILEKISYHAFSALFPVEFGGLPKISFQKSTACNQCNGARSYKSGGLLYACRACNGTGQII